MDVKEYKLFIGGKLKNGRTAREIKSPYNSHTVGKAWFAGKKEMEEALEAARKAFTETSSLSVYDRAQILEELRKGIVKREKELTETITAEGGKPIRFAKNEVFRGQITVQTAAETVKTLKGEILTLDMAPQTRNYKGYVQRFPIGTVIGIAPFNFPLNLVLHKLAPAIATGNPIIIKPASQTPLTSLILAEILAEIDMPDGFVNILPVSGSEAEYMIQDPSVKKLTFTGSAEVGWNLKKLAYKKKVTLELGGNAAAIVHKDVKPETIIPRLAIGAMAHAGQVCISVQRIFVEKSLFAEFTEKFIAEIENNIKYGDPFDPQVVVGPMIDGEAVKKITRKVQTAVAEGAQILTGGKADGPFYLPTVLSNTTPEMEINREEAFAPIVTVEPYSDFHEALEAVNDSRYGLQAGVFTNEADKIEAAYNRLQVGGVIINDYPTFRIDPMPYGGIKDSGFGREGLQYAMEDMTELKLKVVKTN